MILFPFATQATEPAPGASIEEPRLLIDGIFTNRQHKQTQASHSDQHTQTPNTGQADRQTTELKAQPQTDQRSQVGQTAIKRHPPTPGPLGLRVSWPALALDPRTLGVRRQPHPRDRPRRRPHVATAYDTPT